MIDVITKCDSLGNHLSLDGDNIRVENIANLPKEYKEYLIENKMDVIEILKRDAKARESKIMVGIPGIMYMYTISYSSNAYMELQGRVWKCWRESCRKNNRKFSKYKTIAEGNTFNYVFNEFNKYIDYLNRR